jgi:4-hydroxyacetophenone monooxygenase
MATLNLLSATLAALRLSERDGDSQFVDVSLMRKMREMLMGYISGVLEDAPEVLEHAIPDYPPGGKRMVVDDGNWLRAMKRDKRADRGGPDRGYHADRDHNREWPHRSVRRGDLRHGVLGELVPDADGNRGAGWRGAARSLGGTARAYMGVTIPDYPNLFLLYGPNTNIVVNRSTIFFAECEMRYWAASSSRSSARTRRWTSIRR